MPTPTSIDGLIEKASKYLSEEQVERIKTAFEFGKHAHQGQTRKSGGDYIWHPVAVAEILAEIQLDQESLIAAILHDVVEDTPYTKEDITERFGESVSEIVDGVTKLGKLEFESPQEAKAENFRKMVVAMAKDLRVIIVKLADRMHNMRTLQYVATEKQKKIAQETLDIYVPLASRLGINSVKSEMEDLCLRFLKPEIYYRLAEKVAMKKSDRDSYIKKTMDTVVNKLLEYSLKAEVKGRPKHF
ncbi:MAG: HD domain-containing protein, partial [Thiomicrorhabdus sp.]|nr:HD domain-containing protein [Thiomicrorhabdus sp.]